VDEYDFKTQRVSQTDEYLGGYLDALKDRDRAEAEKAAVERGDVTTRNGVWTRSEHGVPITVTQPDDPAYALLSGGHTTTPVVHSDTCYICEDPEFARMGLPLCRKCPECKAAERGEGHIPADDSTCTVCGYDAQAAWEAEQEAKGS
jgi:NAD-dependent dihydropyrimidine dehydrogenase PreA subunit